VIKLSILWDEKSLSANNSEEVLKEMAESTIIEDENTVRNEKIKNLLLASPHKDIEILIDRPIETGRDIQL
jgi:hypothetical protein